MWSFLIRPGEYCTPPALRLWSCADVSLAGLEVVRLLVPSAGSQTQGPRVRGEGLEISSELFEFS